MSKTRVMTALAVAFSLAACGGDKPADNLALAGDSTQPGVAGNDVGNAAAPKSTTTTTTTTTSKTTPTPAAPRPATPAPAAPAPAPIPAARIASGTTVSAKLVNKIVAKDLKAGDAIQLTSSGDLMDTNGGVAFSSGHTFTGHVSDIGADAVTVTISEGLLRGTAVIPTKRVTTAQNGNANKGTAAGAIIGGIAGNIIGQKAGNKTAGTVAGAVGGAIAGRAIGGNQGKEVTQEAEPGTVVKIVAG